MPQEVKNGPWVYTTYTDAELQSIRQQWDSAVREIEKLIALGCSDLAVLLSEVRQRAKSAHERASNGAAWCNEAARRSFSDWM
jgi:hypothetical protein